MKQLIIGAALLFSACTAGISAGPGPGYGGGGGGQPPPTANDSSWSLAERQYWIELQKELDQFAKKVNDHCHTQISASYVQESFRGRLTAGGSYGMEQYARTVSTSMLNAIFDVCTETDMHKQAVAAKVRHVAIAYGPVAYSLDNGTVHASINTDDDQVSSYQRGMVAFLKERL